MQTKSAPGSSNNSDAEFLPSIIDVRSESTADPTKHVDKTVTKFSLNQNGRHSSESVFLLFDGDEDDSPQIVQEISIRDPIDHPMVFHKEPQSQLFVSMTQNEVDESSNSWSNDHDIINQFGINFGVDNPNFTPLNKQCDLQIRKIKCEPSDSDSEIEPAFEPWSDTEIEPETEYSTESALNVQQRIINQGYNCYICGAKFSRQNSLIWHIRAHRNRVGGHNIELSMNPVTSNVSPNTKELSDSKETSVGSVKTSVGSVKTSVGYVKTSLGSVKTSVGSVTTMKNRKRREKMLALLATVRPCHVLLERLIISEKKPKLKAESKNVKLAPSKEKLPMTVKKSVLATIQSPVSKSPKLDRKFVSGKTKKRNRHECCYCHKIFFKRCHLINHQNHKHLKSRGKFKLPAKLNHPCGLCDKIFSRAVLMRIHSRTHALEYQYKCYVCGISFWAHRQFELHARKCIPTSGDGENNQRDDDAIKCSNRNEVSSTTKDIGTSVTGTAMIPSTSESAEGDFTSRSSVPVSPENLSENPKCPGIFTASVFNRSSLPDSPENVSVNPKCADIFTASAFNRLSLSVSPENFSDNLKCAGIVTASAFNRCHVPSDEPLSSTDQVAEFDVESDNSLPIWDVRRVLNVNWDSDCENDTHVASRLTDQFEPIKSINGCYFDDKTLSGFDSPGNGTNLGENVAVKNFVNESDPETSPKSTKLFLAIPKASLEHPQSRAQLANQFDRHWLAVYLEPEKCQSTVTITEQNKWDETIMLTLAHEAHINALSREVYISEPSDNICQTGEKCDDQLFSQPHVSQMSEEIVGIVKNQDEVACSHLLKPTSDDVEMVSGGSAPLDDSDLQAHNRNELESNSLTEMTNSNQPVELIDGVSDVEKGGTRSEYQSPFDLVNLDTTMTEVKPNPLSDIHAKTNVKKTKDLSDTLNLLDEDVINNSSLQKIREALVTKVCHNPVDQTAIVGDSHSVLSRMQERETAICQFRSPNHYITSKRKMTSESTELFLIVPKYKVTRCLDGSDPLEGQYTNQFDLQSMNVTLASTVEPRVKLPISKKQNTQDETILLALAHEVQVSSRSKKQNKHKSMYVEENDRGQPAKQLNDSLHLDRSDKVVNKKRPDIHKSGTEKISPKQFSANDVFQFSGGVNTPSQLERVSREDKNQFKTQYQCRICRQIFLERSLLQIHMQMHKSKVWCQCGECGFVVCDQEELRRHLVSHSSDGEMPFVCYACSFTTSQHDAFLAHLRITHKIVTSPYSNSEMLTETYPVRSHLYS